MNRSFKLILIAAALSLMNTTAEGQFAPAAGLSGSTAIYKTDPQFMEWGIACNLERGYLDIAVPDSGFATIGDANATIGAAGTTGIVSLGDGGKATLSFQHPVFNGPGFDFAVFENGFSSGDSALAFLEFAFVEVSSDGINFSRFPTTSNTQDTAQIGHQEIDCSLVNNLAGKYVSGYGTPFDLEELQNVVGLDINNIISIRVVDVVGSINDQYATHDQFGTKINDPYPTPFPSSGFDLDAVGIIHALGINSIKDLVKDNSLLNIFPNPVAQGEICQLQFKDAGTGSMLKIYDVTGQLIQDVTLDSSNYSFQTGCFSPGLYYVNWETSVQKITAKMIVE